MATPIKLSYFRIVCLVIALSLLYSCSESRGVDGPVGGPCEFQSFPGLVEFTRLKPATNGNEVFFDFTLSDPTASVKYLNNNGKDLQLSIFNGDVPNTVFTDAWLSSNGISVGNTVPAEYKEIRHGTCAPGFISFPTITGASGG